MLSVYSPLTIPGIEPFQIRSNISGIVTGAIFLLLASSVSKSVENDTQSAPIFFHCNNEDIWSNAIRPAGDS